VKAGAFVIADGFHFIYAQNNILHIFKIIKYMNMNTAIYLCDSIQWDKWTALGTMFLAVLTFALAIAAFLAIYYQRE
jgi:hypothetical protein